jgi:hypothetical protein
VQLRWHLQATCSTPTGCWSPPQLCSCAKSDHFTSCRPTPSLCHTVITHTSRRFGIQITALYLTGILEAAAALCVSIIFRSVLTCYFFCLNSVTNDRCSVIKWSYFWHSKGLRLGDYSTSSTGRTTNVQENGDHKRNSGKFLYAVSSQPALRSLSNAVSHRAL